MTERIGRILSEERSVAFASHCVCVVVVGIGSEQ